VSILTLVNEWHARRESNPQPAVLETAALPVELLAYAFVDLGVDELTG
jgi:hypothetical protein